MFSLALAALPNPSEGALLRHTVLETDTAESMQLGRVCFGLKSTRSGRLLCLPAPHLVEEGGGLALDVTVKDNEQAYQIANRALSSNVDKEFVDSLFNKGNFQSVSGAAAIRARYSGTSISYTPLHVLGAFKLSNPSLPELHVAGVKQSVFRLTQNFWLRSVMPWYDAALSASVFRFQRTTAYLDADILAASIERAENLLKKQNKVGVDGDLAVSFLARKPLSPSVGLRIENLANSGECLDCKSRFIDVERYFATTSAATVGVYLPHAVGTSFLGFEAPFFGPFSQFDPLKATVAYAYRLSKLGCFMSFAPVIYTFGFLFDSGGYRLGVMYSDEKQDNSFLIDRQKQTYVFISFFL